MFLRSPIEAALSSENRADVHKVKAAASPRGAGRGAERGAPSNVCLLTSFTAVSICWNNIMTSRYIFFYVERRRRKTIFETF